MSYDLRFTIYALAVLLFVPVVMASGGSRGATSPTSRGVASWYGEEHRGRLMANRKPFNPDHLTCASWFHPLGTRLRVERTDGIPGSVEVVVTDRGPHRRLVRAGRVIDLSRAAFERIEGLEMGLIEVTISPVQGPREKRGSTGKKNWRDENNTPTALVQAATPEWAGPGSPGMSGGVTLAPNPKPRGAREFAVHVPIP